MTSPYYDIDAILAEQEPVPCTFHADIIKIGHLDPNSLDSTLRANTTLELPFWLAAQLRAVVTLLEPKSYSDKYNKAVAAGPQSVDLHAWSPYYYQSGLNYARVARKPEISELLMKTFSERYERIMDKCQNTTSDDLSELTRQFDLLERSLFYAGYSADMEYQQWRQRKTDKINTSLALRSQRKRKRLPTDK